MTDTTRLELTIKPEETVALAVGDIVKVTGKFENIRRESLSVVWTTAMDVTIGEEYQIIAIDEDGDILLDNLYCYLPSVLEKIK